MKKLISVFIFLWLCCFPAFGVEPSEIQVIRASELPREARAVLFEIRSGAAFAYANDGRVFGNYEAHLPQRQRGYYREYTVKKWGTHNRGTMRIISGGFQKPYEAFYFTYDHYKTFKKIL